MTQVCPLGVGTGPGTGTGRTGTGSNKKEIRYRINSGGIYIPPVGLGASQPATQARAAAPPLQQWGSRKAWNNLPVTKV